MKTLRLLIGAASLCAALTAFSAATDPLESGLPATNSPAKRPNIVYLMADQWRASATGYAGDAPRKTLAATKHWSKNALLFPSGLIGSVTLRAAEITPAK